MNKKAVYTAIIGKYDDICQPLVVNSDFDYILFSDAKGIDQIGIWQVRHIDIINGNNKLTSGYVKTHPHVLLPEYEITIWHDANVQIKDCYLYQVADNEPNMSMGGVVHPSRNCIYDECEVLISTGKASLFSVLVQMYAMLKDKYPHKFGLHETGLLIRKNCDIVNKTNDLWWECIKHRCLRDQASFDYVCWKNKLIVNNIFEKAEENVRNSIHFNYYTHIVNKDDKYQERFVIHNNRLVLQSPILIFLEPIINWLYYVKKKVCYRK